jgi:predicted thioesterase
MTEFENRRLQILKDRLENAKSAAGKLRSVRWLASLPKGHSITAKARMLIFKNRRPKA